MGLARRAGRLLQQTSAGDRRGGLRRVPFRTAEPGREWHHRRVLPAERARHRDEHQRQRAAVHAADETPAELAVGEDADAACDAADDGPGAAARVHDRSRKARSVQKPAGGHWRRRAAEHGAHQRLGSGAESLHDDAALAGDAAAAAAPALAAGQLDIDADRRRPVGISAPRAF